MGDVLLKILKITLFKTNHWIKTFKVLILD